MPTHALVRVPAPTAAPLEIGGLLSAAVRGDTSTDEWRQGVYMMPKASPGWRLREDCGPSRLDYGLEDDDDPLPVAAVPFPIQTRVRARTSDLDELRTRGEMAIAEVTAPAIARELWTGEMTREAGGFESPAPESFTLANPRPASSGDDRGGPWLNPYLQAADMLSPEGSPAAAFGAVESAIRRLVSGPVTIHVPTELVAELSQFGLSARGNELRTLLGSSVVAEPGYTGVDDSGGPAIYGTGPVVVYLGDPKVHTDAVELVDPATNEQACWAERDALFLFDSQSLVGCAIT